MPAVIYEKLNSNDPRTNGEQYLLEVFSSSERFAGWTVFEQPHINSMKPDFLLLHPQKGVLIIEVKDWKLDSNVYETGGYIRGQDGKTYKKNPINQVENYKKGILKSGLRNIIFLAEDFNDYFGCIETVVYFHYASKSQAMKFCSTKETVTKIWTKEDIDFIAETKNKLNYKIHTYALALEVSKFNADGLLEILVKELVHYLQYDDYNYERKQPFILTKEQEKVAALNPGSVRRWSGVAGSGKTLILAEKGVRALKDNKRVAILTFNITLRHYLRDLCSQQFGSGSYEGERKKLRRDLTILHFHELLKVVMTEHEIEVDYDTQDDLTSVWMEAINTYLSNNPKKPHFNFDYILIDEGQDFKGEWIRFLKQFFTGKGEMFIVYDKAQDIYNHGLWIEDPDQIKEIGFKGRPGTLKYTHRLPNIMVDKIQAIRYFYKIDAEEIRVSHVEQLSLLQTATWVNCKASYIQEKIIQIEECIYQLMHTNRWEDITILTTNEKTGVEIVEYFEGKGIRTSHVYDMKRNGNYKRRRNEKWKFQGGTDRLKVCSYQSYKGWETPNIIFVLDSPSTDYLGDEIYYLKADHQKILDALFISMSRVKGKAVSGEFSYTCLNYLRDYDVLKTLF